MIISLIDYNDLTEEQKTKVICLYKVRGKKIEDFTIAIDKVHDELVEADLSKDLTEK